MTANREACAGESSRRRFLSETFMTAVGLAAGRASCAVGDKPRRVLVVGAGVSGLAAAAELKARDFDVVVVEARERIGGRVWTAKLQDQPVDLGAPWIEGIAKNPIYDFCKKHQIKSVKSDDDSASVFDRDGQRFGEGVE
jgi:monoamine oxidase